MRQGRRAGADRHYLLVPVPVRASASVPSLLALASLNVNVADRLLATVGLNVCTTVQLLPAFSAVFRAHVPLRANSDGFAPPAVNALMVSVPLPVLVNLTVLAALVVLIL